MDQTVLNMLTVYMFISVLPPGSVTDKQFLILQHEVLWVREDAEYVASMAISRDRVMSAEELEQH